jgi:hypothetical protein
MIFMTSYKVKSYLTKAQTKELMEAFAKYGPGPGVTAHYVAADSSHGVVIADTDDVAGAYRNVLNYGEWVEYDTKVMLTIEEALPHITDSLA